MWRITGATLKELDKPTKKRYIHPEMQNVKQGDELLVFKAEEDEKNECLVYNILDSCDNVPSKFTWCVQTYQEEAGRPEKNEEGVENMGESIRSEEKVRQTRKRTSLL